MSDTPIAANVAPESVTEHPLAIALRRVFWQLDVLVDDFKNLRQEVLDLQKQNRELRKDLDDLKKKLEARAPAAAELPTQKKKPKVQPPKAAP